MAAPRIHKAFPTPLAIAAVVIAFLGERAFGGDETLRAGFAGAAGLALAGAVVVRLQEFLAADAAKRPVARSLLLTTGGVAVALVLYGLGAAVFTEDGASHTRIRSVLSGLWPSVLVVSLAPLVALELAVAPSAFIATYEHARVRKVTQRATALALFVVALFLGNFLAHRHETKLDLSAGHRTVASAATTRTVRDLTKKVEVVLFYPRANEVSERLRRYFEPLAAGNENLSVRVVDFALAGERAKDAKVTENGYVAVFSEGANDKIRVGEKARSARSALRRFDTNFLKSLVKVTTQSRVVYFSAGHGERATGTRDKDDKRASLKLVKQQLEAWQFTIKTWSAGDGATDQVPDDADVLFVMGPERPFFPAEIETLKRATERGVRLFIALEAEREGTALDPLLSALGLGFDRTVLAHEQNYVRLTRTKADRTLLATDKFTSHASVTTLTRQRQPVVFDKTGALRADKAGALPRVKTEMVIHATKGAFADVDGDLDFDAGEPQEKFGLAAAVTRTSTTGKRDDEARIYVLSDVDAVADTIFRNLATNRFLFRDAVAWLARDVEAVAPPVIEDEDVKIVHKKEEDAFVFYGTTFGLPFLVLGVGWLRNRRRR